MASDNTVKIRRSPSQIKRDFIEIKMRDRWIRYPELVDQIIEVSRSGTGLTKIKELELISINFLNETVNLVDLRGINLINKDLSNVDFSFCCLDYSTIKNCEFNDSELQGVSLNNATVIDCKFNNSQASPMSVKNSKLTNVRIKDSYFMETTFIHSILKNVTFTRTNFADSDFRWTKVDSQSKLIANDFDNIKGNIHNRESFVTGYQDNKNKANNLINIFGQIVKHIKRDVYEVAIPKEFYASILKLNVSEDRNRNRFVKALAKQSVRLSARSQQRFDKNKSKTKNSTRAQFYTRKTEMVLIDLHNAADINDLLTEKSNTLKSGEKIKIELELNDGTSPKVKAISLINKLVRNP